MPETQKSRRAIPDQFKWQVSDIYENEKVWEGDFEKVKTNIPELTKFQGTLKSSGSHLLEFIKKMQAIEETIGRLFLYAHMRNDEDKSIPQFQEMYDRTRSLLVEFSQSIAFFQPEILELSNEQLEHFLKKEKGLELYRHFLDNIYRTKKHTLNASEERLLALSGEVMSAPAEIFATWDAADIVFPKIKDEQGNEIQLTQGLYGKFQQSSDRRVRKDSYMGLYVPFIEHRNTLAVNYSSIIKSHIFNARARNYRSTVDAALDENAIPVSIYKNLVEHTRNNLDPLHRYNRIRKEILKLNDGVHDYDLRAPLFTTKEKEFSWDEAIRLCLEGMQPLGPDYMQVLEKSFKEGWIDVYENKGKRTGAYSTGSYGVHPYVLMNYNGSMSDVFTLAHEMGHALHTHYTINNQPFVYGDYPIFLAEVASTANEALLQKYLIDNSPSKKEKLAYLNAYLDKFSQTFYRQVIFAEFELRSHELVEQGQALTADKLDDLFGEIYQTYHGPDFVLDREAKALWSRVPHFYYNYYVFQYSTSFVASSALVAKIIEEGEPARDRFLDFLKSGRSQYPVGTLKQAGIDMSSEEPVLLTIRWMDRLLDELEKMQ
jgi:oligoendopeptidase F